MPMLINEGVQFYQRKQFDEAGAKFLDALKRSDNITLTAMAHLNMGMVYNSKLKYADAVPHFKKAVELLPTDLQAQLDLATSYINVRDLAPAREIAKQLLAKIGGGVEKLNPERGGNVLTAMSVYTLMGNIALASAQWAEAEHAFSNVIKLNDGHSTAYVGLGEALSKQEKHAGVIQALRKAVQLTPNSDQTLFALGMNLIMHAGNIGENKTNCLIEAIHTLERHTDLVGTTWAAMFNIALAKHRLGWLIDAMDTYREALWRYRDQAGMEKLRGLPGREAGQAEVLMAMFYEGECLRATGHYAASQEAYLRAIEMRPTFPAAQSALGAALELTGDFEAARDMNAASIASIKTEFTTGTPHISTTQPWMYFYKHVSGMLRMLFPLDQVVPAIEEWEAFEQHSDASQKQLRATIQQGLDAFDEVRKEKEGGGGGEALSNCEKESKPKAAVVYLCCKDLQEVNNMQVSLRLLYLNFLAEHPYPVMVLHNKYLTRPLIDAIKRAAALPSKEGKAARPPLDLHFVPIDSSREGVSITRVDLECNWSHKGYCDMSRFFAGSVHDLPGLKGYEYMWRLDSDSFILAPIQRDIVAAAACRGCVYSVSALSVEPSAVVHGLFEDVLKHVTMRTGRTLQDHFK
eukprot:CAMPEP_0206218370 /NCGR_PEP_ID=MMETSP0047_2-20121206/3764_1 /ASSEMBLY_ACC=CAM_ASM_000192 /TAXON_ID=195065 /ORGANISM="Chroomonas mesostigmatica_cf, Strain CCMP1168" /LENGTH=632 /DNA_ID=CAMNT_0053640871 /DNA_START=17 /DNA_END=1912 /DNA_ORIENTATION=-